MHRFNTKLNAFFEGQMFPVGQPWVFQLNEYIPDKSVFYTIFP